MPMRSRRNFLLAGGVAGFAMPASPALAGAMRAADLALPSVYGPHIDPAQCLVSEKYDGVRAFWDGSVLRHRSGRPVSVPRWFVAALPSEPLDGELWLGRGRFDRLSAIVRKGVPVDAEWRQLQYMVFELPGGAGTFGARVARIQAIAAIARNAGTAQLHAAPQRTVDDGAALQRLLHEVVDGGGEGLVLHVASASYVGGRTDMLAKLKPYLDAEAVVVGRRPGHGKYADQLGALQVRTPDGRTFFLGSGLDDALRRGPPPLGTVVSYRYRDVTPAGTPRFASFLRVHEAL